MLKQQITALYCRLSREDLHGNGDSSSIQTQKAMLSKFAEDNGLLNAEFYVDDGASGTTFDRENFQRMISDIEDGKVACVVTKDLSRLGRNYLEAGRYRELFTEYGVRYIAMSDGYDSMNDDGDIATPIKEIIHEFYARDCSRKLKAAFKTKAENGGIVLGVPAYGYAKITGTTNRLEPDENAPTVKRMFQLALEGKTCNQIATALCRDNILIPKAYRQQNENYDFTIQFPYKWTPTTVRGILSNPVYTGRLVLRRRTPKSFKDKTIIRQPKENWIFSDNTHKALVSEHDFDTVQERIKVKSRTRESSDNIFRGIAFCSDCGRRMGYSARSGRNCGCFRCGLSMRVGKAACSNHFITSDQMTALVLNDIRRHAGLAAENAGKYAEHLLQISEAERNNGKVAFQKEADKANKRLTEIDTLIQKLYENMIFEVITKERFTSMSANLEAEQKALKERYAELTEYLNNSDEKSRNVELFAKLIQRYTDITELDAELVHTLIEKIVVHETEIVDGEKIKRVDIFYRFVGNVNADEELTVPNFGVRWVKTA
jgi:DNA invertase Pin-like site-specific DNA recombinase